MGWISFGFGKQQHDPAKSFLELMLQQVIALGGNELYIHVSDGCYRTYHNVPIPNQCKSITILKGLIPEADYKELIYFQEYLGKGLGERIMPDGFHEDKSYPIDEHRSLEQALAYKFELPSIKALGDDPKYCELTIDNKKVPATLSRMPKEEGLIYLVTFDVQGR